MYDHDKPIGKESKGKRYEARGCGALILAFEPAERPDEESITAWGESIKSEERKVIRPKNLGQCIFSIRCPTYRTIACPREPAEI